jgi:hypothetical protein
VRALAGRRLPLRWPAVLVAVLLALAATAQLVSMVSPWVDKDSRYVASPRDYEESRTVIAELARERQPGDLVLVGWVGGRFAADYYGPKVGLGGYQLVRSDPLSAGCSAVPFGTQLWEHTRYRRLWLVTTHTSVATIRSYLVQLNAFGPRRGHLSAPGANAYRFDRAHRPRPGPVPQCLSLVSRAAPL